VHDRRKELIRAYKETPMQFGVYRVRNTANDKSLVGASRDLRARLNRHLAELKLGIHPNKTLLRDWYEFGQHAFVFETLDTLEPSDAPDYNPTDDLEVLEALWLEKLQPFGATGYNKAGKRV
jgi:group I intron endonuclease